MTFLRTILALGAITFALPCFAQESPRIDSGDEANLTQMIQDGARLAATGKPREAIEYFDKVAATYEEKYRDSPTRVRCARWSVESLMYLAEAANEQKNTTVLSANWAYAYYLKAYALQELGRLPEAKALLERAITLSPRNAQFLSELGSVYQREKNWPMGLQTYKTAESSAREFSPPNTKDAELAAAWRGIAYILVEQNQLDDAEKLYRQCLELNKNDTKASNELRYVLGLKAKQAGGRQDKGLEQSNRPQDVMKFVFLFGRANYFRVLVKQRRCDLVNEQLFATVNQRFESVRSQLATKYGENTFPFDKPAGGPIYDQECDPITLKSFDMKVSEIEQLLGQQAQRFSNANSEGR